MNRRVLLSFSEQMNQTPLITKLCSEWGDNDRIYVFSTRNTTERQAVSASNNWNLSVPVDRVPVPKGNNRKEIREVFNLIYDVLKEEDVVDIDISFCPRVIEMLLTSLLQYAKFLKNIKIKGIYYEIYENSEVYSFIDLTSFSDIQDWVIAAGDLAYFGNSGYSNQITQPHLFPVFKQSNGHSDLAQKLKGSNIRIENINMDITTNRGKLNIEGKNSEQIFGMLNHLEQYLVDPFNPVLIKSKMPAESKRHEKDKKEHILSAVRWCIDKSLIPEGYALLQEGIVSYFLPDFNNINKRRITSIYLNHRCKKNFNKNVFSGLDEKDVETIEKYLESCPNIKDWSDLFAQITEIRNDITRIGVTDSTPQAKKVESNLKELYKKTEKLILKQNNFPSYCNTYKEFYY
ncbi:MAG: TM1812 family CRISPR-associated protein [Dysgonamonadaceae bacterium]|jgi:hypothetical protein|nr:TM1812 family CRISPR-associated protein [Dysgonamonadaceae bacterium]